MKPIHFQPNSDASARQSAAQQAYRSTQGAGVAAVVRTAASVEHVDSDEHRRRVQLDDYVARIRQSAGATCQPARPEVIFRTSIQDGTKVPSPMAPSEAEAPSQTVRTDTGYVTESSLENPETIQQFNDAVHKLRSPHISHEQFSEEGYQAEQHRRLDAAYQRQIIDDIGVAIASTLTDLPDEQIKEKLPTADVDQTELTESSTALPVDVAAWDVEDFRWPILSNQMIATASDAMQQLFDQVLTVSNDDETRPSNRLAIAGAGRGEGASTIAISLARWAVACGKRVLLVDADLNSPSLTTQVGLQHGLSWLKAVERNDESRRGHHSLTKIKPVRDAHGSDGCTIQLPASPVRFAGSISGKS